MTTLATGLNANSKMTFTAVNGRVYASNNFDPVKVMTADAAYNAGITGPSGALGAATATAGNCTNGNHLIRYRYRDSRTGYVSNPSDALSVTVSGGNGTLTFDVTADYTLSTDSKVDTIDFEMTAVNDSVFYRAKSALNTATAVAVSISDASLVQQVNIDSEYGSAATFDLFSHEPPPAGAVVVAHRNRLFVLGDTPYSITSASFTSSSSTVTYSGGSSKWPNRLIQVTADTVNYTISTVASTTMTLTAVYAGTTGVKTAKVYSKFPNRMYYSRLNMPESFYTSFYARDMLIGRGDRLIAGYSMSEGLFVFGRYSSQVLVFDTDPSALTSNLINIPGNRGVFNQRCLVEAEGRLFAWDRAGVYEVGNRPTIQSFHIDPLLDELVDYSYSAQFHGVYDSVERCLAWFFVASGDTTPKYAIVKELDSDRWQVYRYLQAITASCVMASSDGQVRAWLGDENGYTWAFSTQNSFDGVYPSNPSVLTVTTATTSSFLVSETLETTVGVAGCMAYLPSTGETRLVTANGDHSISVTPAVASAPAAGDEVWLGSIPFEYRTKWWAGEGMQGKKRPSYFYLMLYPGAATGKLQVYFYKDFSDQPYTWEPDASYTGSASDGVTYPNNVMTIDLDAGSGDGFIAVNMPSDWSRAIQARLISQKPDGALRIMDMGFKVIPKAREEVEAPNE